MRDPSRYFDILNSMIRHSPAVDYEISYKENDDGIGTIMATPQFADDSRLDFKEVVEVHAYRPNKLSYTYHYRFSEKDLSLEFNL
jgi:hypothetical protein